MATVLPSKIYYNGGYKYQLKRDYAMELPIRLQDRIDTDFITLTQAGFLYLKKGYAWDGPSGPTIDTPDFMRGSLVHDALYQLMREGYLDRAVYREQADRILQAICIEDGMNKIHAALVYHAVRLFGDPSADPAKKRPTTVAP